MDPAEHAALPPDPRERAPALVAAALAQRGQGAPVDPEDDAIPDPVQGTVEDHAEAARRIHAAVRPLVDAIGAAVPWPQRRPAPPRRPGPPLAGPPPVGPPPGFRPAPPPPGLPPTHLPPGAVPTAARAVPAGRHAAPSGPPVPPPGSVPPGRPVAGGPPPPGPLRGVPPGPPPPAGPSRPEPVDPLSPATPLAALGPALAPDVRSPLPPVAPHGLPAEATDQRPARERPAHDAGEDGHDDAYADLASDLDGDLEGDGVDEEDAPVRAHSTPRAGR
jgi:hypothetical protein